MFKKSNKKGFTLIELIVVMAVIGILVLLAMPKFIGHTKEARLTEVISNIKQLENASERYYIDNQDWPRLSDTPYTSDQLESFAREIKDKTGAIITLDSDGKYYEIDYDKLQKYVQKPKDNISYIIQNPIGEIYYLDNLTEEGKTQLSKTVPSIPNEPETPQIPSGPITLDKVPIGSIVYDDSTKYNGQVIKWKVIDNNHYKDSNNPTIVDHTTLLSDKILTLKAFDGKETSHYNNSRYNFGNNNYKFSNIRQWLNASGSNWYIKQHTYDTAPSSPYQWDWHNPYDTETGFLANLSAQFKNTILPTKIVVGLADFDGGGSEVVEDKVFLLSRTEMGLGNNNKNVAEGVPFSIFDSNNSRLAYPTVEAVNKSTYKSPSLIAPEISLFYWLRSPTTFDPASPYYVEANGSINGRGAYSGFNGIRVALNLKSDIYVLKDESGEYKIVYQNN